jgi:hypothetical protein
MDDYKRVQKLLGPWTVLDALRQRVEREAQVAWALKADAPFQIIPPMKSERWKATPLHVLKSQLWQLVP